MPRSLWPAYERQVGDGDACADHRCLVADHVDAVEQVGPRSRITYVDPVHALGHQGIGAVRLGDERVDADDLVATSGQLLVDLRADEAAGAGEQDPHVGGPGSSNGSVTSSSQSAQVQSVVSGSAGDHLTEQLLEPADVLLEQREHLGLVDRLLGD